MVEITYRCECGAWELAAPADPRDHSPNLEKLLPAGWERLPVRSEEQRLTGWQDRCPTCTEKALKPLTQSEVDAWIQEQREWQRRVQGTPPPSDFQRRLERTLVGLKDYLEP